MGRELEERINAIAAGQFGVVTRQQLTGAGVSRASIRHRLAIRRLRSLHRGVYLVGPVLSPGARRLAAVLACGPGALLSHNDARGLWLEAASSNSDRAEQPGGLQQPVDVTVNHNGRSARPGIRLHRTRRIDPADRAVLDGIPVTTPIRTILDLAPLLDVQQLERLTTRFARERLLDLDRLASRVAAWHGRTGIPALRDLLGQQGGPAFTRSEAEAVFLTLIRKAGLPAPEVNVRLDRYELDFYWRNARLAVEIDGFRHHSSRAQFERDRQKDAWLRSRGISVIRLSWRQITEDATATAVQVGQALVHAVR